jgi:hypothetical protein
MNRYIHTGQKDNYADKETRRDLLDSADTISEIQQMFHGHLVNSKTLSTISNPVGICHINKTTFKAFNAMCRFLAVSLPFCIAGTSAAANAHSTVIATKTRNYHQQKVYFVIVQYRDLLWSIQH